MSITVCIVTKIQKIEVKYLYLWNTVSSIQSVQHEHDYYLHCQAATTTNVSTGFKPTNLPCICIANWYVKQIGEFQQLLFVTFVKFFFYFIGFRSLNKVLYYLWIKASIHYFVIYELVAITSFSCHTKPENLNIFFLITVACELHNHTCLIC